MARPPRCGARGSAGQCAACDGDTRRCGTRDGSAQIEQRIGGGWGWEVYSVKLTLSNNGVYHTIRVKLDELTPSGKNLLRLTDKGEKRFATD